MVTNYSSERRRYSDAEVLEKLLAENPVPNDWSTELLRGFAALLVVFAHYHPIAGINPGLFGLAFTGVDLFFVLSGFIFAPYFFGKRLALGAHFVRRFFRLYPLYAVALLSYAWLRWQPDLSIDYLLKHALFLHTLQSREIAFYFNPAFWSLPAEVEFYLVLPALAWMTGSLRAVLAVFAVALLTHISIAWLMPVDMSVSNAAIASIHLPGLLIEFLMGTISWWVVGRMPTHITRSVMLSSGIVGWFLLAVAYLQLGDKGIWQSDLFRGNLGLFAALAFALIVGAWVGWVERPSAWLVASAKSLGNLSYGVYLFHNAAPLILVGFKASLPGPIFALLCLTCTLATAQVLHWAWEDPCRRYGRSLSLRLLLKHPMRP